MRGVAGEQLAYLRRKAAGSDHASSGCTDPIWDEIEELRSRGLVTPVLPTQHQCACHGRMFYTHTITPLGRIVLAASEAT